MQPQVLANVAVNFKFYRRNRLLLAALLLILLVIGVSAVPAILFMSKTDHLSIITMISTELSGIGTIFTPALGLVLISHHLRSRSAKMVFTKPCPPEAWLMASYVSAVTVAAVFFSAIFVICSVLFVTWGLPFQWGIAYVLLNNFAHALIWLGYVSFLAVVFHPVVAVLVVLVFQEGTFYQLKVLLTSGIKAAGTGSSGFFLKCLKPLVDVLYMVLPVTHPFADETAKVYKTLRGSDADWPALFATWGYTVGISILFFLLGNYFLKRKRLI